MSWLDNPVFVCALIFSFAVLCILCFTADSITKMKLRPDLIRAERDK